MTPTILASVQIADFTEDTWWIWVIKAVFIILYLILSVILALWVERRGLGRMQSRLGPNRVGPLGFGQAFADALKADLKPIFNQLMIDINVPEHKEKVRNLFEQEF